MSTHHDAQTALSRFVVDARQAAEKIPDPSARGAALATISRRAADARDALVAIELSVTRTK